MNGANRTLFQLLYFTAIGLSWSLCQPQFEFNNTIATLKPEKFAANFIENSTTDDGSSEENNKIQINSTETTTATTPQPLNPESDQTIFYNHFFTSSDNNLEDNDLNKLEPNKTRLNVTSLELLTDEVTSNYDQQYYINAEEQEPEETETKTDIYSDGNSKSPTSTSLPDALLTEDYIEKKINEAINSITKKIDKLPELVLSDNKTHFKFHKNSKEMIIDEKITEIAKQLAEKSLRNQYEKQKLGAEHVNLKKFKNSEKFPYAYKSFKAKKIEFSGYKSRSISNGSVNETEVITNITSQSTPFHLKLSSTVKESTESTATDTSSKPTTDSDQEFYELVTDLPFILNLNKSEDQMKEISQMLKPKKKLEILPAD